MAEMMLFVAALAACLTGGNHCLGGAPTCSPSRTHILIGQGADRIQDSLPTCSPSRVYILIGQPSP